MAIIFIIRRNNSPEIIPVITAARKPIPKFFTNRANCSGTEALVRTCRSIVYSPFRSAFYYTYEKYQGLFLYVTKFFIREVGMVTTTMITIDPFFLPPKASISSITI